MANDTLKKNVSRLLRTPGMEKIGFQLGALTVTGQKLGQVAQAIDDGKIQCLTVKELELKQGPITLPKGMTIEAQYKEEFNAMLFRDESYGTAPGEDRTIVHEAVHASFDLLTPKKGFQTLAMDDESAAVLTEALYIKVCGLPVGGFKMMAPQAEAWNLAGLMSIETDDFTKGGIYNLDPSQTADLRAEVAKAWGFVQVPDKTGYTDNSTAIYVYNGMVKCNKRGICK